MNESTDLPTPEQPQSGHHWDWAANAPASQWPARRMRRRGTPPVVAAAIAVVTVAGSALVTHELWPAGSAAAAAASQGPPPSLQFPSDPTSGIPSSSSEGTGGPSDVSSIASKVDPDLVLIDTTFRYQQAEGAGTGIVLTSNGEILTNNHVINGATSIKVTDMGNGRTYTADVVGYDSSHDVAVLQLVGASGLRTAPIASSAVKVGTPVVAIGNAGGSGSLTPAGGSVTGLDKSITASDELDGVNENLTGLIETNANVQAGDSGGPLVNSAGEVVAMDTAASQGYSLQSRYSSGSDGYAIPINDALTIARAIGSGRSSTTTHVGPTAFIGVLISSGNVGQSFQGYGGYGGYGGYDNQGSSGSGSSSTGAEVAGVVQGGSAAAAGLVEGDTITALDGRTVSSGTDLSRITSGLAPGQTMPLSYTDTAGTSHTVAITLQSGPPA